jgi:hypothetical protein
MNVLKVAATYIPAGVSIEKMHYADGNVCLAARDPNDGSPYGTLSVNIPETNINDNHVWIKDWSENEGVLNALVESGLVRDLGITQPCGFMNAHLVELKLELYAVT